MKSTRREFISHSAKGLLAIGALPYLAACTKQNSYFPIVSPESEGVDSQAIIDFIKAANNSGLEWHSFKILRRGNLLAQGHWSPFKEEYKHTLYSLSKSFTSSAIGFAIKENLISVEDPVISFFPNDLPGVTGDKLTNMKVRHLLTMTTGHDSGTMPSMRGKEDSQTWVQSFLADPLMHEPGSHFLYNTGATYILGAIIHAKTGQTLVEYLKPRLFDKLGMSDYDWEVSPEGLNTGGYGLRVKTEDIAKLGQLYLQEGIWEGETLLDKEWVTAATSKQTESQSGDGDWSQGYGYQFWRCKPEPGFYRGDGAFGQYCIVIPSYEMIIAVTSESWDMAKSMQLIWNHILPGVKDKKLAANKTVLQELREDCQNLQITPPIWHKSSAISTAISKQVFTFESNDFDIQQIRFQFNQSESKVFIKTSKGENELRFGMEQWANNEQGISNNFPMPRNLMPSIMACSATWLDDQTLLIDRKFVEAIHGDQLICFFDNNTLEISFNNSVSANSNRGKDPRKSITSVA